MPKKEFKETGFGKFLNKAGNAIKRHGGDVLEIAATAVTNPVAAIGKAREVLQRGEQKDEEAQALLAELQLKQMEFKLEMEKLNVEMVKSHHELEAIQLQQEDKWTKRARPTRQYFWLLIITLMIVLDFKNFQESSNLVFLDFNNPLLYIMGADFGYYQFNRTQEKKAKVAV